MPMTPLSGRPPLVLIASGQEWSSRSLETILAPNGWTVLRVYTGATAIQRARGAKPDLIILDTALPDYEGLDLCRRLRRDPQIRASTAILVISPDAPTRQRRIDALRAGASEHLGQPLDAEEFLLRTEAFARATLDADQGREQGLVDPATGLYNMRGFARRARELASQAARHHRPLACVVFAAQVSPPDSDAASDDQVAAAVQRLTSALTVTGRVSDAIGRLGPTEFAVVALGTDAAGSVKLAERLAQAVDSAADQNAAPLFELRAGYYSVPDFHAAPVDALGAVLRATAALQLARTDPQGSWLRQFGSNREAGP